MLFALGDTDMEYYKTWLHGTTGGEGWDIETMARSNWNVLKPN